jgi:two-component system nitrogen regulation response regulator NtrX
VLVADDEDGIRRSLRKILELEGYRVLEAVDGIQAISLVREEQPDVAFLDIKMPECDGLEVLKTLEGHLGATAVVMISGHGTIQTALEATRLGAFDFLEKPLSRDRVVLAMRNAMQQSALKRENQLLRAEVSPKYQMIGQSAPFKALLEKLNKVGPTRASVLIRGETGTGKELMARALHDASGRRGRFVQVNCAAIPEELIESELFGHVKGAFTGAIRAQKGKFELADQGTLFLDEVADMSLKTQAKVLRVLQEGEVEPVGSHQTLSVDVRIIAATNKDLESMVQSGSFREDLLFRLNVIPLHSLPLRERREDIPLLIDHFCLQFARDNQRPLVPLSAEMVNFLHHQPFPGNIRELKNTVDRLLILGEHELSMSLKASHDEGDDTSENPLNSFFEAFPTLKAFRDEMERRYLSYHIDQCGGNLSKTADRIGTPRSNLYKKLEQFQIKPSG